MIKGLFTIRLKQLFRELESLGLFRTLFLLALTGFIASILFRISADKTLSPYLSIASLFIILLIHLKRSDKVFLKSYFSNYKILFLLEYLFLSFPIILFLLINHQWIALSGFTGIFLIINLDIKNKYSGLNTKLQAMIPSDSIEWKAGLRKQFFFILPIWFIAILSSFMIGSIPLAIIVIGIACVSYYEKCEPWQILISYESGPKKLLLLKIKRDLQLFSVQILPLIGVFLIFHMERWYIPVAEYLIFCSLHIYLIVTKYSFFEASSKSAAAQTFSSIGFICCIIPVFLPLMWCLTIYFYIKSLNKLKPYLNDYN